jgi:peptidoglycan hydrolase CwlO-like protein
MFKKIVVIFLLTLFAIKPLFAQSTEAEELQNQINEYTAQISKLSSEKNTLSQQIKIMDSQIMLNQVKINQTQNQIVKLEKEIQSLSEDIGKLDLNLNQLTNIFIEQINQNYKIQKQGPPIAYFLFNKFNSFWEQRKYMLTIQKKSQETIVGMETIRATKDIQKNEKETKQKELEELKNNLATQKNNLDKQKASKNQLLEVTKNSEANYQKLLSQARSELAAIEGILAGRGEESLGGHVNAGDKIASVIVGSSCNSSGTHLHFMVQSNGKNQNPFSYLKSIDHINDSGGDPFNPSGGWDWPMKATIKLTQGYGYTWAVAHTWVKRIYSFHNGLDFNSSSDTSVYTPHSGVLYRGAFKGNCTLKYVRVENKTDNIETYYLHVNYF